MSNFVVFATVRGLQVSRETLSIRQAEEFTRTNETMFVFGSRLEQVLISLFVSLFCQVVNGLANLLTLLSFWFSPAPAVVPVALRSANLRQGTLETIFLLPGGSRVSWTVLPAFQERRAFARPVYYRTSNGIKRCIPAKPPTIRQVNSRA